MNVWISKKYTEILGSSWMLQHLYNFPSQENNSGLKCLNDLQTLAACECFFLFFFSVRLDCEARSYCTHFFTGF